MPKRILLVAMKYFPSTGGTVTYTHSLATVLHREGYEVRLLAPDYRSKRPFVAEEPFHVARMKMTDPAWGILHGVAAMWHVLIHALTFRPDIIWATAGGGVRVLSPFFFLKWVFGTKMIGTVHGSDFSILGGQYRIIGWLELLPQKLFFHFADMVVTPSRFTQQLKIDLGCRLPRSQVIYNCIPIDIHRHKTKADSLSRFPHLNGRSVILTVSRLSPGKGLDTSLRAISRLIPAHPNIYYLLVGEGEEKTTLEDLAGKLNIRSHVEMTGYISEADLEFYYGACDIFILPSCSIKGQVEGFGLVFLEAGLRGKPVIGTRHGGISEAIRENITGFLVNENDDEALAHTIERMIKDKALCDRLSQNAREIILNSFSEKAFAVRVENMLQEVFARKNQPNRDRV
jgi:phosphatidylinositol alpha-1,6-mannosyltransferase